MDVSKLIVGTSGVTVAEVANHVEPPTSGDVSEIIKIIVQVVIGIATLIGLFKKNPKTGNNPHKNN